MGDAVWRGCRQGIIASHCEATNDVQEIHIGDNLARWGRVGSNRWPCRQLGEPCHMLGLAGPSKISKNGLEVFGAGRRIRTKSLCTLEATLDLGKIRTTITDMKAPKTWTSARTEDKFTLGCMVAELSRHQLERHAPKPNQQRPWRTPQDSK